MTGPEATGFRGEEPAPQAALARTVRMVVQGAATGGLYPATPVAPEHGTTTPSPRLANRALAAKAQAAMAHPRELGAQDLGLVAEARGGPE